MIAPLAKPGGKTARAFRAVFQRFHDKTVASPEEDIVAHARGYSKIFNQAGAPDYLEGAYQGIAPFLAFEAPGARAIWNDIGELNDRFNAVRDRYLQEVPAPAKPKRRNARAKSSL
jgi:hypothetical protein